MSVAAYLLCKVRMGCVERVVAALRELEAATSIAVTTGEFDVIVRLDLPSLEDLYHMTVERIGRIEGLEDMATAVVEKEF